MTERIPLVDLTSDALDALYERLEAAEATETQRQLATARKAFASATTRAARAEAAVARVRALAARIRQGVPWTANDDTIADRIETALQDTAPMTNLPASAAPAAAAHPLIKGRCPACRGASLFLGSGGYVTCSRLDCPSPTAADDLLHGEQPAPTGSDPSDQG